MKKVKQYKIFHTNKLFCNKYPYRVVVSRLVIDQNNDIDGWSLSDCKEWFKSKKITDFKIYNKIRVMHKGTAIICAFFNKKTIQRSKLLLSASVFLKTKSDFNAFVKKYESDVNNVTIPISNAHVSILENDKSIVSRKSLFYKKYRYVIKFKYHYVFNRFNNFDDSENDFVNDWLKANFIDLDKDCKLTTFGKTLYLNDIDDLMLIKLSLGDEILKIVEVRTFDEIKSIQ